MTTSEANDQATPQARRATTADLSWMLWTAIGIGGIWVAVLLLSLLAPDLVSGSEQEHLPVAAFTAWFWGAVGTMVLLWAMGRLRGSARSQPIWIGLSVVTLALWAWPRSLASRSRCLRPAPIQHKSPWLPCLRQLLRRC
jgi:hypothetical protein